MRPITVLVSASGAPSTASASARPPRQRRTERPHGPCGHVRAVGGTTPVRHVPPRAGEVGPGLPGRDPRCCRGEESVDAVLPQSSFDLQGLAEHRERFQCRCSCPGQNDGARTTRPRRTRLLHRLGVAGASVPARPGCGNGGVVGLRGARYPDRPVCFPSRLLEWLPAASDPRPHGRPGSPAAAHERPGSVAMRLEEGSRAAPRRGRPQAHS